MREYSSNFQTVFNTRFLLLAGFGLIISTSLVAGEASNGSEEVQPKVKWFTSSVDHFNSQDHRTFQQRCLVNTSAWSGSPESPSNAPIFFYTGNEGHIESFYNNTGFVFDHAPEFAALVVFCEHRYYGESLPFGNATFERANMGYLSIAQALADFAMLIPAVRAQYGASEESMTIAFGGSYGGMLTAWMRLKYPDVVDAGLAASAPMGFVFGATGNPGFFTAVTNDVAAVDPRCPNLVRSAFSQILSASTAGALEQVAQTLKLCNNELKFNQIDHLMLWARNAFTTLGMMDYPYPTDFLAPLPGFPIKGACEAMLEVEKAGGSALSGLQRVAAMVYAGQKVTSDGDGDDKCYLVDEYIQCADQTGCGSDNDSTAWDYQACAEINLLVSTNNKTDMFPPHIWNLQNLTSYCENKWGVTPNPDWVRTYFGGTPEDPAKGFRESGSRIIFSNGLLDPWHGGGYMSNLSSSMPVVILPEGAHHLDLRAQNELDPVTTTKAREVEIGYIREWVKAGREGVASTAGAVEYKVGEKKEKTLSFHRKMIKYTQSVAAVM